jgi:multiple sugar transport system substrate-binding protein
MRHVRLVVVILAWAFLAAHGALGSGQPEPKAGGASATAEAATLVSFWHIFPEGDQTFALFQAMIERFNAAHPSIRVEHQGISFWDYWTKLSTSVAGGTGPDIAFNTTENVQARIKANVLANLSPYFQRDGIRRSDYIERQLDYMSDAGGNLRAFPYGTPVRVLYWDKDMFRAAGLDPESPPKDWVELEAYADKLTTFRGGNKDLIDTIGFDPAMGNFYFWTLAWTNGGQFFDAEGRPTIDASRNLEALEWMVKMHRKYGTKAMQAMQSQNASLKVDPFVAGKAAMEVHNEALLAQVRQYAPEKNIGIAAIPYARERANWSSGFTLEISDKGEAGRADAAWEFFRVLISTESQKAFFDSTGWIMSDKRFLSDPAVSKDPLFAAILAEAPYARDRVYIEEVPAWHVTIAPEIEAALLGEKSPKVALDTAQRLVEEAIANYKKTN